MQRRGPCRPWRGTLASGHKPRCGLLALQSLESNPQLSFATRMEDWTCLGQHKRQPEFPVVTRESRRNSGKTTWLPRHRKMKPFPATAPQEKSHVRYWRSKRYLAPLMRPTKCPDIPVSLKRNTEVFPHHFLRSEEHTSELQSPLNLVCRLLLEKKKKRKKQKTCNNKQV